MGFFVEGGVEGEDWARAFEAVACEVELFHCVDWEMLRSVSWEGEGGYTVLHVHFYGGAVGGFAHP